MLGIKPGPLQDQRVLYLAGLSLQPLETMSFLSLLTGCEWGLSGSSGKSSPSMGNSFSIHTDEAPLHLTSLHPQPIDSTEMPRPWAITAELYTPSRAAGFSGRATGSPSTLSYKGGMSAINKSRPSKSLANWHSWSKKHGGHFAPTSPLTHTHRHTYYTCTYTHTCMYTHYTHIHTHNVTERNTISNLIFFQI